MLVFAPAAAISEQEDRGRRKADPVLHGTPRIKAINWHNSQALPDPAELIETCASSARCFTLVVDSDGAPLAYSAGQEPVSPRPTRRSRQHAAQTAAGAVAASADGSAAVLARRGGIEQGNGAPFANTLRPPAATGPGGGPGLAAGAIEQGMPVACLLSRTGIARLLAGLGSDDPPPACTHQSR